MFNSIFEEEKVFPYINMSLEDARLLRYLISNIYSFRNGELVQMLLKNTDGVIMANGLVYEEGNNKAFYSEVAYWDKDRIDIYSEIEEIGKKSFYSIDKFRFKEKTIEVISKVEAQEEVIREISYQDPTLELK